MLPYSCSSRRRRLRERRWHSASSFLVPLLVLALSIATTIVEARRGDNKMKRHNAADEAVTATTDTNRALAHLTTATVEPTAAPISTSTTTNINNNNNRDIIGAIIGHLAFVAQNNDPNQHVLPMPIGLCEGDCDSNADCQSGLICYERDGSSNNNNEHGKEEEEVVPGCVGMAVDNVDYCIDARYVEGYQNNAQAGVGSIHADAAGQHQEDQQEEEGVSWWWWWGQQQEEPLHQPTYEPTEQDQLWNIQDENEVTAAINTEETIAEGGWWWWQDQETAAQEEVAVAQPIEEEAAVPPATDEPTYYPTAEPPTDEPTRKPTDEAQQYWNIPIQNEGTTATSTNINTDIDTTDQYKPTTTTTDSSLQLGEGLYYDTTTGLHVAHGLTVELVATTGEPVQFVPRAGRKLNHDMPLDSGTCTFHSQPDGAATFHDEDIHTDGGFHYCINSEETPHGGVYCLEMDSDCRVVDYVKRLGGRSDDGCDEPFPNAPVRTEWNCNGGATPWNSWVSCEEIERSEGGGYCWQVDPFGRREPQRIRAIGTGEWEAMAVDARHSVPVFYFSEDDSSGAVRRMTPRGSSSNPVGWDTLHDDDAEVRYLVLRQDMTYYWSSNLDDGRDSAIRRFPNVEGIAFDEVGGVPTLFFVSKTLEKLFSLNLDSNTYRMESTNGPLIGEGSFKSDPDIVVPIAGRYLFIAEDGGGTPGVYMKDLRNESYYTMFQDNDPVDHGDGEEATGIAMSPDGKCMMSCLQERGSCYVFRREDGGTMKHLNTRLRIR